VKECLLLKNNEAKNPITLIPHYNGFKGTITPLNEENNKYLIKGIYVILSDKQVRVTELPIGSWTDDYKKYIEELIDFKPVVQSQEKEKTDKKTDKKRGLENIKIDEQM
jgi:DNA topoisomerase-2